MKYIIYIQNVYGNATGSHLALRAVAKETGDPLKRKWLSPWKTPTEIITACGGLMVDREFLARLGRSYGEWSYTCGRSGHGCRGWYEVEYECEDESVTHTALQLSIDNKWSLWTTWGFDGGYDFVEPLFRTMPLFSAIDVKLACWKEIRYGSLLICRDSLGYHVSGEMHTVWDDESKTEHAFRWTRRSVKHMMKQIDHEEDALLKADEWRSKNEPMLDEQESDD